MDPPINAKLDIAPLVMNSSDNVKVEVPSLVADPLSNAKFEVAPLVVSYIDYHIHFTTKRKLGSR